MRHLHIRAHEILIAVIVILCCMSLHSCVAASQVDTAAQEWDAIVASGKTPTAEQLNHFSQTMDGLSKTGHASLVAAESGDWKTLLVQGLVGLVALGGTGVATYAKVNADRNASSPQRTQSDLATLGVPTPANPMAIPTPKAVS